ncbi:MAG: hypothetical protein HOA14_13700 [Planctomycetaceae bacterium]|nr:hypothetical protein [Planctomycetaceae bacterium]
MASLIYLFTLLSLTESYPKIDESYRALRTLPSHPTTGPPGKENGGCMAWRFQQQDK